MHWLPLVLKQVTIQYKARTAQDLPELDEKYSQSRNVTPFLGACVARLEHQNMALQRATVNRHVTRQPDATIYVAAKWQRAQSALPCTKISKLFH
jgi:hypothetical protein